VRSSSRYLIGICAALALAVAAWVLWSSSNAPIAVARSVDPVAERAAERRAEFEQLASEPERKAVSPELTPVAAVESATAELVASGPLEGTVIDLEGQALEGVLAVLQSKSGERIERVSDAAGHFAIDELAGDQEWTAHAEREPALKFCHSTGVHQDKHGAWQPLVLVMTAGGALDVAVVDAQGAPITEGLSIQVSLSGAERARRPTAMITPLYWAVGQAFHSSKDEPVGTDGSARFPWVWADRALRVSVSSEKSGPRWGERQVQGLLVLEKEDLAGEVIRVPAGGRLDLRVQAFDLRRTLAGKVSFADGKPVVRPSIFLRANGRPSSELYRMQARGEEDGTFSVVLDGLREGEVLRVRATDGDVDQHSGSHSGGVEVPVAGSNLRADIVVGAMLPIAGRITRAGNPPNPGTLRFLAEPPENPAAPDDIGYQPVTPEGFFELRSLAPGTYELEFTERVPWADAKFRLSGVQAGDTAVQWELPQIDRAQVSIGVRAGRALAQFSIVVAQPLEPRQGAPWPAAPEACVVTSGGWPLRSWTPKSSVHRGGGCTIDGTSFNYRQEKFDALTGTAQKTLDLPAGVYSFAAMAWDAQGRALAPVLATTAEYLAGRYQITFDLAPTAAVEGSVANVHPDLGLELIALDARGQRLPMFDIAGETRLRLPLSPDGHFSALGLPAGLVVLRVATPADLERGLFGAEHKLQLTAGETATVSMRW